MNATVCRYFYPMLFGEPQHHPKFDPETMFMEGPHGREYLRNRLKVEDHLHLPRDDQDNKDKIALLPGARTWAPWRPPRHWAGRSSPASHSWGQGDSAHQSCLRCEQIILSS